MTGSTRYDDSYFYFERKFFDVLIKDKNVLYNKCPFGVLHSHFTSVVQRHLNLTNLKHVWTMPFEGLCVRMKEEISRITSIYVGIIYIAYLSA